MVSLVFRPLIWTTAGDRRRGRRGRVLTDPLVFPRVVILLFVAARPVDGDKLTGYLLAVRGRAAWHLIGADPDFPPGACPRSPAGCVPLAAGLVRIRRVRRRGGVSRIRCMIRRRAASSSGVHAVKERCLSASTSEAIQPRAGGSSPRSRPGSVPGMTRTASAAATDCGRSTSCLFAGASLSRK
jgi:hypothetical protein